MPLREQFLLDPGVAYLNHGGFGATPIPVVAHRERLLREFERNPTRATLADLIPDVDAALGELAHTLGVPVETLAFTNNTTVGLNLIARSVMPTLNRGDEVLVTDVEYGSQLILWDFICRKREASLRTVRLCGVHPAAVPDAVEEALTDRTRIVMMSHISSMTALRLPVEEVAQRVARHGSVFVVDGAHAPGQVALDLPSIGADYYVGNLHKWYAAARPAGFLYATRERQERLDPLVINWGGVDRAETLASRTHLPGTSDTSQWLSVPTAIEFHKTFLAPARDRARRLLEETAEALALLGFERIGRQNDDLMMSSWWLPAEIDGDTLAARLLQNQIEAVVGTHDERPLLRICVAWYTVEAELERLLETCDKARVG